jgi:hypothetical protein
MRAPSLPSLKLVSALAIAVLGVAGAGCGSGDPDPGIPGPGGSGGASGGSGGRGAGTTGGRGGGGSSAGSGGSSTAGSGGAAGSAGSGGSAGTGGSAAGSGGSAAGSGGASAGSGGAAGGSAGSGGGAVDASASDSGAATGDAPPAGTGGLGPGSADDSPPLVLPGSKLIFDGKTLTGWNPCDASRWSVKDGTIDGNGSGNNFCQTADDHDTFRLTGKSRMVRDPSNHAGICFWGNRGAGGGGCLQITPVSGSLWDYGGGGGVRTNPRTRPYDKWNFFELLVDLKTGKVDIAVEGQVYPTYTDRRLANRKKGPIGLQLHAGSNEVQYKDLALEDNPTEMRLLTGKP